MTVRAWGRTAAIIGALVFGLAMLAMYTVSSLYHSVPWSEKWKIRLQRIDHSMIYLMVAGTFTPIAIAALEGTSLVVGLVLVWSIAITGILLKALMPSVRTWLSVTLQLAMGWVAIFWMPDILERLGFGALALILAGGFCYTVGAIIFMTKRPRLLPRTFSYHELFHVLVVAASIFHFAAIVAYAIPATV
jgi:hemolysin III